MIAHVRGQVAEKFANSVIIDVQGVGYEVTLSSIDFDNLNLEDEVKLYTYHHIREQAEELFGFTSLAAKKLFELLITVQGIGPKAAMAILSLATPEEVRNAIANADAGYISKASGVGKKAAEQEGQHHHNHFSHHAANLAKTVKKQRRPRGAPLSMCDPGDSSYSNRSGRISMSQAV